MSDLAALDPRAQKIQTVAKLVGTSVVTVLAAGAIIVTGTSIVAAAIVGIAGLFAVNFAIPISARSIALWKQKALTSLAETFSEETIREDERAEGDRIKVLEEQYVTTRSVLEGAYEELAEQMKLATLEEQPPYQSQLDQIQGVIAHAEQTLLARKEDFIELQRLNKLYIAAHRAAIAIAKATGADRNSEEMQRVETARNAIKTKMRAAMAGKTIQQMNSALTKPQSGAKVFGSATPKGQPLAETKEMKERVRDMEGTAK